MIRAKYKVAMESWRAIVKNYRLKHVARRAVEVGGTSIVAFTLGHVSRPLAIIGLLATIVWLERKDPNGDEELEAAMAEIDTDEIIDTVDSASDALEALEGKQKSSRRKKR